MAKLEASKASDGQGCRGRTELKAAVAEFKKTFA
jgi:hypothetical protein